MHSETFRHRLVKRMVAVSIFLTMSFGIGSIYYAILQGKTEDFLTRSRSDRALRISTAIDKEFALRLSLKAVRKCKISAPASCTSLIEYLISSMNRIQDYRVFMTRTMGAKNDSTITKKLIRAQEEINSFSRNYFGRSLETPQNERIMTAHKFANSLNSQQETTVKNSLHSGRELEISAERLEANILETLTAVKRTNEHRERQGQMPPLSRALTAIVTLELILFILVSMVDIVINNADPNIGNEFNRRKLQPKVKPLGASMLFGIMVVIGSRQLVFTENSKIELEHCREVTRQDIEFLNLLGSHDSPAKAVQVIDELTPPEICKRWLDPKEINELRALDDLYKTVGSEEKIEVVAEKARLYADTYGVKSGDLGSRTRFILFFILIANVSSLCLLAIFLRLDSADLG